MLLLLQISEDTHRLLPPELQADFNQREAVEVKGKGIMRTFVTRNAAAEAEAAGAVDAVMAVEDVAGAASSGSLQ